MANLKTTLLENSHSSCLLIPLQVGSVTNTFNVPGVEENCFFLKDMEGAKALRQRINECFEISALPSTTPEERKRLLTFVVVGHTAVNSVYNCFLKYWALAQNYRWIWTGQHYARVVDN